MEKKGGKIRFTSRNKTLSVRILLWSLLLAAPKLLKGNQNTSPYWKCISAKFIES